MKTIPEEKVIELVKLQNKLIEEIFNSIEQAIKSEAFSNGNIKLASVNKILFKLRYIRAETLKGIGAIR